MADWKDVGEWARAVRSAEAGGVPDPRLVEVDNLVGLEGGPGDGTRCPCDAPRLLIPGGIPLMSIPEQEAAGLFMVPSHDPRWNACRTPDVYYADTGRRTADGRRVFAPEA